MLREGYDEKSIFITGNTVIDALKYTIKDDYKFKDEVLSQIDFENKKVILLTSHRRENIGEKMEHIFSGIKRAVEEVKDAIVVFPVHLNPRVREIANRVFKENEDIYLVEPLEYEPFTNLMARSFIVVTDSGGLQEEAPALGKPVLVIRDETERPEGISAGTAKLVGTEEENAYKNLKELLTDEKLYSKMARAVNPYGDGKASERIVDILLDKLSK